MTRRAVDKHEFALRLEEEGIGGQRVYILGRDERYTGTFSMSGRSGAFGNMAAANAYTAVTGKGTIPFLDARYDIVFRYDKAREGPGAFMKQYCFDGKGQMESSLIRYPGDKVELQVDFGATERIDVTDWAFGWVNSGKNRVHPEIEKMITECIEGAGEK